MEMMLKIGLIAGGVFSLYLLISNTLESRAEIKKLRAGNVIANALGENYKPL